MSDYSMLTELMRLPVRYYAILQDKNTVGFGHYLFNNKIVYCHICIYIFFRFSVIYIYIYVDRGKYIIIIAYIFFCTAYIKKKKKHFIYIIEC